MSRIPEWLVAAGFIAFVLIARPVADWLRNRKLPKPTTTTTVIIRARGKEVGRIES